MQIQNKKEFIDKISNKLAKYEKVRVQKMLHLILQEAITIVVIYYTFKFGLMAYTHNIDFACFILYLISFLCFGLLFYALHDFNKKFKIFLKKKCRSTIIKAFELDTIKGVYFNLDTLKQSNLFSVFNTYTHDDIIEGTYKDVDYKIAETELISKGNKGALSVFKGIVISFNSNKKIKADTLVTTKGDLNIRNYPPNNKFLLFLLLSSLGVHSFIFLTYFTINIKASIPSIISFIIPFVIFVPVILIQKRKMQDVKLEDVSFDKRFNVYTTDQVEARYILTPTFMEKLKSLETAFGAKNIKCSFFDDQTMFAIPCKKDLFELGSLFKPLNSNKSIENFYNELHSIQQMIDHFKLNEKIGL